MVDPLRSLPKLLEVAQAAHRLNFGQAYVLKLIQQKKLIAIRIENHWRIDPVDLQAFIDARRTSRQESGA